MKDAKCDHICGVPYTALPVATLLSIQAKIPMLMRRKEAKGYGTKKMIEGHYKAGQKCLIIEDVVTSGSSVLETVKDLHKEGLIATEAVIILDREQGGRENLETNKVQMKSLFTMTKLIEILLSHGKITSKVADEVQDYLKSTKAPSNGMYQTQIIILHSSFKSSFIVSYDILHNLRALRAWVPCAITGT